MNVQKLAKLFAFVFVPVGILGFVPGITSDGMLLGIFEVKTLHNIVHLATRLVAFWAASTAANSRLFFKVFGLMYVLVTILGFTLGRNILGLIMVNVADNLLHVAVTAVALYTGFGMKE